jgi:biopolymer transport protein ExbD
MKLNSPVPHKKARIEIIPLIDIMFFLLASFMLVSLSMIRLKSVKMSLPPASMATTEPKSDFFTVGISSGGDILWGTDKTPISAEDLKSKIVPLYEAKNEVRILINADTNAKHGTVMDVLDKIRAAGVTKVSFATKLRNPGENPPAPPPTTAPGSSVTTTPPAP